VLSRIAVVLSKTLIPVVEIHACGEVEVNGVAGNGAATESSGVETDADLVRQDQRC
jgi:hypothetical protein